MNVVLDTNIFVVGFIDLAEGTESTETVILKDLLTKQDTILLSSILEEQIMRVVLRIKDKNFAGLIRHMIWSDFSVEFVDIENTKLKEEFKDKIPRKDLGIFLTALIGNADYLVSNDKELIQKASVVQNKFKCMVPKDFVEVH